MHQRRINGLPADIQPVTRSVTQRVHKMPQSGAKEVKSQKSSRVTRVEHASSSPTTESDIKNHSEEFTQGTDFSQATFEYHAALLGDNRGVRPMHARRRAMIVQQLQRDYGNHYVQRLVNHITGSRAEGSQTKLVVGPAADRHEREADSVAKQVVRGTGRGPITDSDTPSQSAQMEPSNIREGEEVQHQPLDKIQRQVLTSEEEEDLLQTKRLDIQRRVGIDGGLIEPNMESDINAARGQGRGLPDTLRESMESSFGADFGGVRLHNNANSDSLNENLNSRAFTIGQDIFVRSQDSGLTSLESRELLAHELTHVVQQNSATVRRDDAVVSPPDEKKSGVRAVAGWGVEQIEKGVGWVSENVEKVGKAGKTWLQKKLSAGWKVLRKKYPWLATFLEGVFGVVVNVAELGWSGLKLIARVAWFVLKSFGKSLLSNIGKVIDIGWKFISGKTWEEVDLFSDTRAWFKDLNDNKKNFFTWTEFVGIWVGNARDTVGWIALITGLAALIPGPQAAVLGTISGVTGIITLILSAFPPILSTISLVGRLIEYDENLEQGNPVEESKKRIGRLSVLAIGDWSSLIGAVIGMATEVLPSETVKQSTGAIIGGFTEGTGELATGTVEEHTKKGTPWSEIREQIRKKGETAWEGLFTNLNRIIGLISSVAKLVAVGFKALGMIFGGLATAVGGVIDLIAAAKSKKQTGEWNLNWDKANSMIEGVKNWNKWEKEKFFPGIWNFGNFVEDIMTWAATEKGNLFKRLDGTGKNFSTVREEGKAKRGS